MVRGPPHGGERSKPYIYNLIDHLEGTVEIPVNSGQSKLSLCQQYPPEQVELAFHAWNFINHALTKEDDRKTMKRAETPCGALKELRAIYEPESAMQPSEDMQALLSVKVTPRDNPGLILRDMLGKAESLTTAGLTVNENFVLHQFVNSLSDEFAMTKHALRHTKKLTQDIVMNEVNIEHKAIKDAIEEKRDKKGKGARGTEQAYLADGGGRKGRSYGGRGRGNNRGRGRGRGGGRGGGGGRSGRKDGGVEESK